MRPHPGVAALFLLWATAGAAAPLIGHHKQQDLIERSLQRRVNESAKDDEVHHFYFVRLSPGNDWVYWPEGRLLWSTILDPYYEKKGPAEIRARAVWDLRLYCPRNPIDLDNGVVASEAELRPLDWHVTKAYAEKIIAECITQGEVITLRRKKTG